MNGGAERVRPLDQCRVVITGGTSGVGLATALQFAKAGVPRMALLGRSEERGRRARDTVRERFPTSHVEFVSVDANDVTQAARAVERVNSMFDGVDVLVNSTTAAYVPTLLHEIPVEKVRAILTEQALAPLLMSRLVLPGMRAQRFGVVINIASDAGKVATPGETVLGAAMAAIIMFSRTLAIEAKRDGVRVNVVTPSLIKGTRVYAGAMKQGFSAKLFEKAASIAHLGVAEPDDLASLIVFLASPAAARLTGQAISVNGGISAA